MHGTGTALGDPIEMGAACAVAGTGSTGLWAALSIVHSDLSCPGADEAAQENFFPQDMISPPQETGNHQIEESPCSSQVLSCT